VRRRRQSELSYSSASRGKAQGRRRGRSLQIRDHSLELQTVGLFGGPDGEGWGRERIGEGAAAVGRGERGGALGVYYDLLNRRGRERAPTNPSCVEGIGTGELERKKSTQFQ